MFGVVKPVLSRYLLTRAYISIDFSCIREDMGQNFKIVYVMFHMIRNRGEKCGFIIPYKGIDLYAIFFFELLLACSPYLIRDCSDITGDLLIMNTP